MRATWTLIAVVALATGAVGFLSISLPLRHPSRHVGGEHFSMSADGASSQHRPGDDGLQLTRTGWLQVRSRNTTALSMAGDIENGHTLGVVREQCLVGRECVSER